MINPPDVMALSFLNLSSVVILFGVVTADWTNLHVKYALWDGFYSVPLSVSEVKKQSPPEYMFVDHDQDLNVDLYSYPDDPRFFILFDSYGNIAGLRTGYIKGDLSKRAASLNQTFPYDVIDHQPLYTRGNYWNTSLWYTSVLFVSPSILRAGGRPDTAGLVAKDIYVPLEGKWTLIPKNQCQAESLGFTKQACFIGMGMHYFYKMKTTTECSELPGLFTLYECGQLIGLGIIPFGSFTSKGRTWFEDPPVSAVKEIVPNRPECLLDWITSYGTTSIHIFFKRYPRLTFCVWPWQKSDQCSK